MTPTMFCAQEGRRWPALGCPIALLLLTSLIADAQNAPLRYWAVEASAQPQIAPPQITLSWPADPNATGYTIHRKRLHDTSWGSAVSLPGNAVSWSDSNVSVGSAFEYQLSKTTSLNYTGYGYIYAGIEAPLTENRGKVLLVIDNSHAGALASELNRLKQDLIGDGWIVIRRDVSRNDTPPSVKAVIKSVYDSDPSNLKAVFLFGRIPVPYSGDMAPDGHENHRGAWPADVYYGEMTGTWTDSTVNITTAERNRNWNVPGDGKFDQSEIPSEVELAVGRVDLSNMTTFSNKTPSRSELDLLRQYLNKDHNFRHKRFDIERRGLICDNFGLRGPDPVAASGWRNFAPFFGAQNVVEVGNSQYFPTLRSQGYLWSYGAGGGQYFTVNGVGVSDDFATNDIRTVFTMFMGSYFGDWDNESNFLRAALGSTSHVLTSSYAGFPHWFYHHMALGETIGHSVRVTQHNATNGLYSFQHQGSHHVHIALMGDPTLRMHMVAPPSNLSASSAGGGVALNWNAAADSDLRGYHVYRSTSADGPFSRVNGSSPVSGTSFTDNPPAGTYTYMVRAIKLERSGSGTYFNPSQGIFTTATATGGGTPTPPAAPSNLQAQADSTSQITLTWDDNANDETGFAIERKTGAGGSFSEVTNQPANVRTWTDVKLAPDTPYSYRIRAYNANGHSAYSNEAGARMLAPALPNQAWTGFVETDTQTQGSWKTKYGADGYHVINDAVSYPGDVQVTPSGQSSWTWSSATTEARALQKANHPTERIAAGWYAAASFSIQFDFPTTQTNRLALYFLDWDNTGRVGRVDVIDTVSGATLDTREVSAFRDGKYLVWDIRGRVRLNLARTAGSNALLNGIFFGGAAGQPNPVEPLTLSASQSANGGVEVRVRGVAGQRFILQASGDLQQWTPILTNQLSTAEFNYTVTPSPSAGQVRRYFRSESIP